MAQFLPGQSGNPAGRSKGSSGGRVQALLALDGMLAKRKNHRAQEKALESDFIRDPIRFFKTVVMPLLPREARLSLEPEGVVHWRSLVGPEETDGNGNVNGIDERDRLDGPSESNRLLEA